LDDVASFVKFEFKEIVSEKLSIEKENFDIIDTMINEIIIQKQNGFRKNFMLKNHSFPILRVQ
jgi:hypothetical protein